MFPVELAENLTMDPEAAAEEMCARAPELRQIVQAFALLVRERMDLETDLSGLPAPQDFDKEAFGAGQPLLAGIDLSIFHAGFVRSAQRRLPMIGKVFSPMQSHASALLSAFEAMPHLPALLMEASLNAFPDALGALAREVGVPAGALSFLALELLKPCLRSLEERATPLVDDALWFKGWCPVCGGAPDYGLLKEKHDPSDYLVSKSGRLWLHCRLCGRFWRFVRLVCPACGENDHQQLDVFTARGRERDRIHACRSCSRYLPVLDLVESRRKLHPDLLALGFIPLEILAGQKGYAPIAPAPWNSLG